MSYTGDNGPWLTISEAAERTGKKIDAMRALVRRGRLPRKKGNRGEWLVQLPETLTQAALDSDSDSDLGAALDSDLGSELATLREQLLELQTALGQAIERAARAEGELAAELRSSASLTALLTEERARVDQLRADHRSTVSELRAELAEARRPWLARVLDGLRRR